LTGGSPSRTHAGVGERVFVAGNGGWGTAVAIVLAANGHEVSLWGHDLAYLAEVARTRENPKYLPGVTIPEAIAIGPSLEPLSRAGIVFEAVPTQHLRTVMRQLAPHHRPLTPVVSLTKGIELDTFRRPTEIIAAELGGTPVAAASGPSHAEEVARGLPTTIVAASTSPELARKVQLLLSGPVLRVYTNADLVGVEIAGALKNVIALAGGICDGLQFGDNSKAALLTRGLVEIARMGVALGASRETFGGLAGMGDLITTCFSPHGRNRAVGERIGRGESLEAILASTQKVAEGVRTTQAVRPLAARLAVDMPITEQIHRVLFAGLCPRQAVRELMLRDFKAEL